MHVTRGRCYSRIGCPGQPAYGRLQDSTGRTGMTGDVSRMNCCNPHAGRWHCTVHTNQVRDVLDEREMKERDNRVTGGSTLPSTLPRPPLTRGLGRGCVRQYVNAHHSSGDDAPVGVTYRLGNYSLGGHEPRAPLETYSTDGGTAVISAHCK